MAAIDVDDLLSDESNDSFFEDPKLLAKRGSLTKTVEKKSVSDIFGISEDKDPPAKKAEDDWLGIGGTDAARKPKDQAKKVGFEEDEEILSSLGMAKKGERKGVPKEGIKKSSFEEDEDILSSLGFSKKANVEVEKNPAPSKKGGLFDDILGVSPKKERKQVDFGDLLVDTKQKPKPPEMEQKGTTPPVARETRRSRTASSALADPLGLFSTTEPTHQDITKPPDEAGDAGRKPAEAIAPAPKAKPAQTRSAPNITEFPDWLSGTTAPVKLHKSEPDIPLATAPKPEEEHQEKKGISKEETLETPILDTLIAQQKLATANVGLQNTAIAMQQQESQLMVALQLKKYEEKLIEMQKQQQEILMKQDRQFNDLLQKQFLKQQILEDSMKQQQQRIQNHIELLIQQPLPAGNTAINERNDDLKKTKEDESVKLYEDIISILKQRQHEEMFLLEESYK